MANVHPIASTVGAEGGEVYVDGPGGTAYSMTPDAAYETAERLRLGATEARGQHKEAIARKNDR